MIRLFWRRPRGEGQLVHPMWPQGGRPCGGPRCGLASVPYGGTNTPPAVGYQSGNRPNSMGNAIGDAVGEAVAEAVGDAECDTISEAVGHEVGDVTGDTVINAIADTNGENVDIFFVNGLSILSQILS